MQATVDFRIYPVNKSHDRSLLYIACAVTFIHFVFMIWAALAPSDKIVPYKPAEKLVVKTIDLKPVKTQTQAVVQAPPSPPPASESVMERISESLTEPEPVAIVEPMVEAEPEIELIPVPEPLIDKPKPKKAEPKKPEPNKETPKPKKEVAKPKPKETPKKPAPKKEVTKPKPKENKVAKPKVEPKKTEPKKEAPEKPKANVQTALDQKQRELLAKAQQSIANIDKTRGKIASAKTSDLLMATTLPGRIDALQIDALPDAEPLTVREIGYRDELASRLRLLLKLPEHGEVKVKLTLERSGKVAKLVIVNSQSAVNKSYIEKKVPALTFAPFGNNFDGEAQYTFLIALSNEF